MIRADATKDKVAVACLFIKHGLPLNNVRWNSAQKAREELVERFGIISLSKTITLQRARDDGLIQRVLRKCQRYWSGIVPTSLKQVDGSGIQRQVPEVNPT